jgi:nitroreductase / dihydropteridine reductase
MSFLESMRNRYTTKVYDGSKKIDPEKIEQLKEILQLSPSSINSQPWQFTFVSDAETKQQLSKISWHNTDKVINCDTVVVFSRVENIALFEQDIETRLPEGAVGFYRQFTKPKPANEINAWFEKQVYLALGVFLSACAEMGIDATAMEGIEPDKYDEVLNQKDFKTIVAVAIGYRDPEDFNQPSKKPKARKAMDAVIKTV